MNILNQDIKYLPGVGPNRQKLLNQELGIETFGDLLEYYPYKYVDRSKVYTVHELTGDMPFVQVIGRILSFETFEMGPHKERVVAHFSDGTGIMDLVWFNGGKYAMKNYKIGTEYLVFGKPGVYNNRIQVQHPDIDAAESLELSDMGMQPYYNTSEKMKKSGLNSRAIERLTKTLLSVLKDPLPETIPDFISSQLHLMGRDEALRTLHYPKDSKTLERARLRMKFEELFFVQLNILRYASDQRRKYRGYVFNRIGDIFNSFYSQNLPFELTGAQKRVMREIRQDVCSGRQMNRLLQGDVGSGKTLVALMAMLIALDNGFQACIMAPTEILAEQHLVTIREFLKDMPVRVELLTGIVKGKKRQEVLDGLLTGEVQILVGTHAVIEDTVQFAQLGLAVVDEQHRFGVAQRQKLLAKAHTMPHLLSMTATPIPRSLQLTIFGDLAVSVLDELPAGRQPITTKIVSPVSTAQMWDAIEKELDAGHQAYYICKKIDNKGESELKSVQAEVKKIAKRFPNYNVAYLHGKMKPAEKDEIMTLFAKNEIQVLVSTTVVEVGVNVPNATAMVIADADQYGLSQLHQLRGRVGRGSAASYCYLVNSSVDNPTKRLREIERSQDGFYLAEVDLKLRGPGEIYGSLQHGAMDLRIASITDTKLVHKADRLVKDFIKHGYNMVEYKELSASVRKYQRLTTLN